MYAYVLVCVFVLEEERGAGGGIGSTCRGLGSVYGTWITLKWRLTETRSGPFFGQKSTDFLEGMKKPVMFPETKGQV